MDDSEKIFEITPDNREKILKKIPAKPGVYIYRDPDNQIIYIGKAKSLNQRVRQYFQKNLQSPKNKILVKKIRSVEIIETLSEFDTVLLEAKLIYSRQPRYNILAKDDKSPIYVKLTASETLPRVIFIRKPKISGSGAEMVSGDYIFGPFQSAKFIRRMMSDLRRIVPFCLQKRRDGKNCFDSHIGLCNPCPSLISGLPETSEKKQLTNKYRRNIFRIRDIMSGKSKKVLAEMRLRMNRLSGEKKFEEAIIVRNQINYFYTLLRAKYDPLIFLERQNLENVAQHQLDRLKKVLINYIPELKKLRRIECYDISNLQGINATGSMTVMVRGLIDTSQYRKFKIRASGPNDTAMMAEVIKRRMNHTNWDYPDLVVVDGGKGQVSIVSSVLSGLGISIPVIGLAKRREEIIIRDKNSFHRISLKLTDPAILLLERIRDEAHKFAIGYHRKLRLV